jgi:hypothetical protein
MILTPEEEAWYQAEYGISVQNLRQGFIPAAEVRWVITYSPVEGHEDFANDLFDNEETQDLTAAQGAKLLDGETMYVTPKGDWFCLHHDSGVCRWYVDT